MVKRSLHPAASSTYLTLSPCFLPAGPQTTRVLHNILHETHPASLPPRPPPRNFLTGSRRLVEARELGIAPAALPSVLGRERFFAGQIESSEGRWSVAYLKKKVLRQMEERGEVVKVTRAKWDKLAPDSEGGKESGEEEMKAGPKGKRTARREEEEHVWVAKEQWDERWALGKDAREATKEANIATGRVEGAKELRKAYGLDGRP